MRRILTLAVGVILGQWLAYGSVQSPAQFDTLAMHAFSRHDYVEAARLWTHAVSLQPDNAIFHYLRGTALARLGQRQSASDAYQLALMLEPSADIARLVRQGLAELRRPATSARARETDVSVEPSRGVWVAMATINGTHEGRFLIDTGSSVTIVSPAAATLLGLSLTPIADSVELQTLAGKTAGQRSVLRSNSPTSPWSFTSRASASTASSAIPCSVATRSPSTPIAASCISASSTIAEPPPPLGVE
jgi:aspartyl protease